MVAKAPAPEPEAAPEAASEEEAAKPKRRSRAKKVPVVETAEPEAAPAKPAAAQPATDLTPVASNDGAEDPDQPRRSGWWARTFQ